MSKLSHFDSQGQAKMVDVGGKAVTHRKAVAIGRIDMKQDTLELIKQGKHKKGDVLSIARIAGIMAAKKTAELIPLCHQIMLTSIKLDFSFDEDNPAVICTAKADSHERTGVEMEALIALDIALLTIYDMCKAVDRAMTITNIHLLEKQGGASGHFKHVSSS